LVNGSELTWNTLAALGAAWAAAFAGAEQTSTTLDGTEHPVFAAVDVHYPPTGGARAALVMASDATFSAITSEKTVHIEHVAPYQPGEFYRRELPPLRAVLLGVDALDLLIVDGYVTLDPDGRPGLGAHAHAEFGVPVIGVAKTKFAPATHAIPVLRGSAAKPLYVSSAGIPPLDAADLVRAMAGNFRLPDALRRADTLARGH
jgi:deoxyribonuclease V